MVEKEGKGGGRDGEGEEMGVGVEGKQEGRRGSRGSGGGE